MKGKLINNKYKVIIVCSVLIILIFCYIMLALLNKNIVSEYESSIFPNVYLDEYDMSNYDFKQATEIIKNSENEILNRKVIIYVNSNEFEYSLRDLGLEINAEETIKHIKDFQDNISFSKKLWYLNNNFSSNKFKIFFDVNPEVFKSFFDNLSNTCNKEVIDGYFETSEGVKYVAGSDGFQLDYERSYQEVKKYFFGNYDEINMKLDFFGKTTKAKSNDSYLEIDTMTSSFVTEFNAWIYARSQNLHAGVSYINGAIVNPGEIFSFYEYAGPYDKEGFVFYYEYVGNGVCQVATTVYDAALLGGLEIIERYPHKKKSEYVAGGLDATVASGPGWVTDMRWKNTYDYPIYIKAYIVDNQIHVEFWSNSKAKNGYEYSTEAVWLGGRGYRTYLHKFKDGEEVSRDVITTTWYRED